MCIRDRPGLAEAADALVAGVRAALADDLDAPAAVAALFDFVRAANRELDLGGSDPLAVARAREAFALADGVLDLVPETAAADAALSSWVEAQLVARADARSRRDFAAADAIRAAMEARGVVVEDGAGGTRWKLVR
jgi:cysteinyl-tRNA synthetase